MSDVDLQAAGNEAADIALASVKERFETGEVPSHMYYHNTWHTGGVIDKAVKIGAALGMDDRQLVITKIAASFHDTVQDWVAVTKDNGAVNRVRHAGQNETASAYEAIMTVAKLGIPLTPAEKGQITAAILATIPGWAVEYSTVNQPFLTVTSGPIARAVALADLGSSGMDPETFLLDGPTLFAEENLDVMEAVLKANTASEIPAETQDFYRGRFIGWLNIQPGFARGRQRHLNDVDLNGVSDEGKTNVLALFSKFDESIAAAEKAVADAQNEDFVTLMRRLDARAFPGGA